MNELSIVAARVGQEPELLIEMHKLRHRVFAGRLGWDVVSTGDMEFDSYDTLGGEYLLLIDRSEQLIGSIRMLPTSGPTMLANTFPQLLGDQPMPVSETIWESSRFCIDTERTQAIGVHDQRSGASIATHALLAGMLEWAVSKRLTELVTVTDLMVERITTRAGCLTTRIAPPLKIGKTSAVAVMCPVNQHQINRLCTSAGLEGPVYVPNKEQGLWAASLIR